MKGPVSSIVSAACTAPAVIARFTRGRAHCRTVSWLLGLGVIALASALALPAEAHHLTDQQNQIIQHPYVGNVGQPSSSATQNLKNFDLAQAFTTGGNSGGYTLETLRVVFSTGFSANYDQVYVNVYTADSLGRPTSNYIGGTIGVPGAGTSSISFHVGSQVISGGLRLEPNTTYALVFQSGLSSSTVATSFTSANGENSSSAPGWSIANGSFKRARCLGSPCEAWTSNTDALKLDLIFRNGRRADPSWLKVADAVGYEGPNATLDFVVTLQPASTRRITVKYKTHGRSGALLGATSGQDFEATRGVLTFEAGETTKTIKVPIIDDNVDDSGETMQVELYDPSDGGSLFDSRATGTINNSDPIPGPVNAPPTGALVITGTPQVGVTLTADISGIADEDGMDDPAFTYTWFRKIDGGGIYTLSCCGASTYTPRRADEGHVLYVSVAYTDGTGNRESVTSEPTVAVAAAIPAEAPPDVEGSPTVSLKCWGVTNVRDAADSYPGVTFGLSVGGERTSNTEGGGVVGGVPYSVYWHVEFSEPVHKLDGEMSEITSQDGTAIVTPVHGGPTSGRPNLATVINPPAWLVAEYEAEEHYSEGYRYNAAVLSQWGADPVASEVGGIKISVPAGTAKDRGGNLSSAASKPLYLSHNWKVSVADASATEGTDATIDFVVTLNAQDDCKTATVDWTTEDGTATAGEDYTAASGTLTFAPGETTKTVSVVVLDDQAEDSGETFTLRLGNASGVEIADAEATGTIQNAETRSLTATFEDMPAEHDGSSVFTFRVRFSENPAVGFRTLRDESFAVTGGTVKRATRVNGRHDLREIHIEPSGVGDVTVTLAGGRTCGTTGAICTQDGKVLSSTLTATVPGPSAGQAETTDTTQLTASFEGMPAEHDGSSEFSFRVKFSEDPEVSSNSLRDEAFSVTGGAVKRAVLVNGRQDLREIHVKPSGDADVTITLAGGRTCGTTGAVCTEDGKALSNTQTATVPGPAKLSVADAEVQEAPGATLDFVLTLSRAAVKRITVYYKTYDGTATAGADYTAANASVVFSPGDTAKTVSVAVLDDALDEGSETMNLWLWGARGVTTQQVTDPHAVGTIVNSDPLQKMWLSRFGRAVASHVVDAVSERLTGGLSGSYVTVGGQTVDLSRSAGEAWPEETLSRASEAELNAPGMWPTASDSSRAEEALRGASAFTRTVSGRELLLGSSFHVAADVDGSGPALAAWGRVTMGGFDAEAPAERGQVRLDGEVTTGILGADAEWSRVRAGVSVSMSEGEGTFHQPGVDQGKLESSLTGVHPYARMAVSDRVSAWGLLGYGTGDMTITQAANEDRGEAVTRTDIAMRLGAAGARGVLVQADESGGFDLALRGDAFLVKMESAMAANTTATTADASRLRLILEGSTNFETGGGGRFTPGLELGLRHDGGDAETGTGVEMGGRLSYADPGSGLSIDARARTLLAHEASGLEEWGASASVRLDPGPSGRGLSLSIAPSLGATSSGLDRLWSADDAADLAGYGEFDAQQRLDAEVGYGLGGPSGLGVVTPYAGLGLASADGRSWRAGARWQVAPTVSLDFEATRSEAANSNEAPQHGMMLRGAIRW